MWSVATPTNKDWADRFKVTTKLFSYYLFCTDFQNQITSLFSGGRIAERYRKALRYSTLSLKDPILQANVFQ